MPAPGPRRGSRRPGKPADVPVGRGAPLVCWFEDCRKGIVGPRRRQVLVARRADQRRHARAAGLRSLPPATSASSPTPGSRHRGAFDARRRRHGRPRRARSRRARIRAGADRVAPALLDRARTTEIAECYRAASRCAARCPRRPWRCLSATAEDLPTRALPDSRTPTCGSAASTRCCTTCASASRACTPGARSPTAPASFDDERLAISVGVQKMATPTPPA